MNLRTCKFLLLLSLIINTALVSSHGRKDTSDKLKRMNIAENAYSTGCLVEASNVCSLFQNVFERGDCYDNAYVNCPLNAKGFREWLEKGPRK